MDIGFVVDTSAGVNWPRVSQFAKAMLRQFHISSDGDHVGFITYSLTPALGFRFNALSGSGYTINGVEGLIDKLVNLRGSGRRLDLALDMANQQLFSQAGGARPSARQVSL